MFDTILSGGEVHDGTGAAPVRTDVGLRDGRVAEIGDLSRAECGRRLDASGRIVCPGFIDVHSHSDAYLLVEPSAPSKVFQGVTTEVVGNCGASAAPRFGAARMPSDWAQQTYPGRWNTVAEYRDLLDHVEPAPNVALLIGHNNIRASAMGYEPRAPDESERARMESLLDRALEEGGCGLSTGLVYSPGMFAEAEEIRALGRVAARHGALYTSHMRSEGSRLLEALDETIDVGRSAGCRVEVSHLKTSGPANWGLLDAALERIERARADGVEVAADRYPYTASCTDLDVLLPAWAAAGGRDEILARLRDPAERGRIREDILKDRAPDYWSRVMVGSTSHPDNLRFMGRPLPEVAAGLSMEPVDAALHLIDTDDLKTGGIFFGMSEDNMWRILAQPWVMIGSDGSLRAPEGPLSHDHPHPRNYGTFPRLLRASLEGRTVPLPEMIRKMTSLPATHFRLRDRGAIRRGAWADVLVIDPASVQDTATFAKPHQLAAGIDWMFVNGVTTIAKGALTGRRGGRFLDGRG